MEAFEHVVKAYMESQGYVVSSNVKFPVRLRTRKSTYKEFQTHGYEVDIVAARADSLVLGSVKSFLGSLGVNRQGFQGIADEFRRTEFSQYRIFNDHKVRNGIIREACERYGYSRESMTIKLFVGKFRPGEQIIIETHLSRMEDRGVRFEVVGLDKIVQGLMEKAKERTYLNDPVIMTLKVLDAAGKLSKG